MQKKSLLQKAIDNAIKVQKGDITPIRLIHFENETYWLRNECGCENVVNMYRKKINRSIMTIDTLIVDGENRMLLKKVSDFSQAKQMYDEYCTKNNIALKSYNYHTHTNYGKDFKPK